MQYPGKKVRALTDSCDNNRAIFSIPVFIPFLFYTYIILAAVFHQCTLDSDLTDCLLDMYSACVAEQEHVY